MTPKLISRIEFARIAGVAPSSVTRRCESDLAPACHGMRIDVAHPAAQAYLAKLAKRGAKRTSVENAQAAHARTPPAKPAENEADAPPAPSRPAKKQRPAPPAPSPDPPAKEPVRLVAREVRDVSEVADMTIRQVVAKFGTVTAFKDWLAALRTIEDVREKNLRNAETDGNLISIRLVRTHVMGALESGNRRLLSDAPKTIARQLYAAAKSEVPIEEAEQLVREIISSQLKPMKDAAAKSLRGQAPT